MITFEEAQQLKAYDVVEDNSSRGAFYYFCVTKYHKNIHKPTEWQILICDIRLIDEPKRIRDLMSFYMTRRSAEHYNLSNKKL
jgi:hypothetical protein